MSRLFAQNIAQKFTISGYISEKGSKEMLPGVSIYAVNQKAGTITNNYGFFSLTLPSDSVELLISFVGYKPGNEKIALVKNILPEKVVFVCFGENVLRVYQKIFMDTFYICNSNLFDDQEI